MPKIYTYKSKDHELDGLSPKKVALELRRIKEENDGILTRQDVVNASKPKNALLHKHFEWDNNIAGNEYRLHQAGRIVHCVQVTNTATQNTTPTMVRVVAPPGSRASARDTVAYVEAADLKMHSEVAIRKLKSVKDRLLHLKNEYSSLADLKPVWDIIEELCGS